MLHPCTCCFVLNVWQTLLQIPSIAVKHATYVIVVSNCLFLLLHFRHSAFSNTLVSLFCCHATCNRIVIATRKVRERVENTAQAAKVACHIVNLYDYQTLKLRFPFNVYIILVCLTFRYVFRYLYMCIMFLGDITWKMFQIAATVVII